jgi:hypothetical protein
MYVREGREELAVPLSVRVQASAEWVLQKKKKWFSAIKIVEIMDPNERKFS